MLAGLDRLLLNLEAILCKLVTDRSLSEEPESHFNLLVTKEENIYGGRKIW